MTNETSHASYNPKPKEGVDVPIDKAKWTFESLKTAGAYFLKDTALTDQNKTFGQKEVDQIHKFLQASAIINPQVFNPSTQEHFFLTARYALTLSRNLKGELLNPYLVESLALLHDIGRVFSHRPGRTDFINKSLLKAASVRPQVLELLPPQDAEKLKDMDKENRLKASITAIIQIADVLAKRKNGRLRTWDDVIEATKQIAETKPEREGKWPSEYWRQKTINQHNQEGKLVQLYKSLAQWAENHLQKSPEEATGKMRSAFEDKSNSLQFLPEEPQFQFKTVIFDIGGVIKHGIMSKDDNALHNRLFSIYQPKNDSEKKKIVALLDLYMKQLSVGIIDSHKLKEKLDEQLGHKDYDFDQISSQGNSFIDPVMVDLALFLKKSGTRVIIASNTISTHWQTTEEDFQGANLPFERINECQNIEKANAQIKKAEERGNFPLFTSFDLKAAKAGLVARADGLSFFEAIAKIANLDPKTTLVIDDKSENCQEAKTYAMQTYLFQASTNLVISLIERLPTP